jgi:para-aminobenzoate synthetase component I
MGSMTGAPKIRAMQIIEECESHAYGALYSGAVGYITPASRDFDFNVIIRSILYNQTRKVPEFYGRKCHYHCFRT